MINLDKKIFGKITTKEIIGADPPIFPETNNLLQTEFLRLIKNLESKTKDDLKKLLVEQQIINKEMNGRPGAMALAQDKIKLFTEYNQKYIHFINEKLVL